MGNARPIILSAGGTGGHMFPALAFADHLRQAGYRVILATDQRGLRFVPAQPENDVRVLSADTLRPGLLYKLLGGLRLLLGLMQGLILIISTRPACVVGFGGYPSVPAVLAAQILRVPTVLHQSDAVLGAANKYLAFGARAVALSYIPDAWPHRARYVVTGNPLRRAFVSLADAPYPDIGDTINILVVGGSLGAGVFADVIPEAILQLPAALQRRISLMQQVRADQIAAVQARYEAAGIKAELAPFFTDMPARMAACHLFIGRAGAITVSELTTTGRPAIFIPYPHHADRQQYKNAGAVVAAGGAWLYDEKTMQPAQLAALLQEVLEHPEILVKAASCAKTSGHPDAAEKLLHLIQQVARS